MQRQRRSVVSVITVPLVNDVSRSVPQDNWSVREEGQIVKGADNVSEKDAWKFFLHGTFRDSELLRAGKVMARRPGIRDRM